MCKLILDILGITNILGSRKTAPAYSVDNTVLRTDGSSISYGIATANDTILKYIQGGVEMTDTYTVPPYVRSIAIQADENTDIVFDYGLAMISLNNGVTFVAFGAYLEKPIVPVDTLRVLDLRNCVLPNYYSSIETPNNISTIYGIADNTINRDTTLAYLNYSTVSHGMLYIDHTQTYAQDVISAAAAKGWAVRFL